MKNRTLDFGGATWLISSVLVLSFFLPDHAEATRFVPIDISSSVTDPLVPYDHPPVGNVVLGGVPFQLPSLQMVWTRNIQAPVIAVSPSTPADSIYVLVNTTNTFLYAGAFPGEVVGWLDVAFVGGEHQSIDLVLGENVREWRPANDCGETINTLTSSLSRNVHSDTTPMACLPGSGPAVLDMLTAPIDPPYRHLPISSITVFDDSENANGAWQPTIFVAGLTVCAEDFVPVLPTTWGGVKATFLGSR